MGMNRELNMYYTHEMRGPIMRLGKPPIKRMEERKMKSKIYFLSLAIILAVNVLSGPCFASEDSEPVIQDKVYPELGLKAHSWITGSGDETIAHTQIVDSATGAVLRQIDKKCDYKYE